MPPPPPPIPLSVYAAPQHSWYTAYMMQQQHSSGTSVMTTMNHTARVMGELPLRRCTGAKLVTPSLLSSLEEDETTGRGAAGEERGEGESRTPVELEMLGSGKSGSVCARVDSLLAVLQQQLSTSAMQQMRAAERDITR